MNYVAFVKELNNILQKQPSAESTTIQAPQNLEEQAAEILENMIQNVPSDVKQALLKEWLAQHRTAAVVSSYVLSKDRRRQLQERARQAKEDVDNYLSRLSDGEGPQPGTWQK